jgi:hypothetical protein
MSQSNAGDLGNTKEAKLPPRDWVLLPMLSLMTIALMVGSLRLVSVRMFTAAKITPWNCIVTNDPSTGFRAIPNSVCLEKLPESQLIEYRFNSCGHRAGMECRSKLSGTYRIVMVGSSMGLGYSVAREKTFAALLPAELARLCQRRIELYNESMAGRPPRIVARRFSEVLAEKPDLVLWQLTPWDIELAASVLPEHDLPQAVNKAPSLPGETPGLLARVSNRMKVVSAMKRSLDGIAEMFSRAQADFSTTDTALPLLHFLYESRSQYVKSYLVLPDHEAGFLKAQPSAEWQTHLAEFDRYAAEIEAQCGAAGVPLVVVLLPNRAQVAMISMGDWPAGYDPYKLDDEVRSVINKHGGTFIDILPAFRNIPNPEQHYFPVDGHPNADGHRIISGLLAKALTSGAVPSLSIGQQQPNTQGEQGK